ncbi:MAG: peptidylprolyl isomerase [Deltaproteobacteria bacterium]|nr:peptidylprolyl isomerase [Deltaproteobacteria bacterium]MBI2230419.1 peptidylprolyl isomerase [Deltaproteobacteria bacterium]MBI3064369.1 peptidylprolyl isomerase [Deltaproteobacteria bacterium]
MRTIQRAFILGLVAIVLSTAAPLMAAQSAKEDKVVKDGAAVSLQYTVSGEDGKTIDSNKGKEPLKYTQGTKQIIPGLEKALTGMKVGEEKRVKVKPEDGYGPVNEKAFQEVPKEKIPADSLKVGAVLTANGPQGQSMPVRVHQIKEKTVVIDMNHPMAGKTLVFDVKILDIQAAAPPQPPKPAQAK